MHLCNLHHAYIFTHTILGIVFLLCITRFTTYYASFYYYLRIFFYAIFFMSQFFEDLEIDLPTKKNVKVEKNKQKKEENKKEDFENLVKNIEINEKSIENLIKELKKHQKKFIKDGLPEFLKVFFEDLKEKSTGKIKNITVKYLQKIENNTLRDSTQKDDGNALRDDGRVDGRVDGNASRDDGAQEMLKKGEARLNEEINKILVKEDLKEEKLLKLLKSTEKYNEKAKILLTLLTFYIKKRNYFEKAIEVLNLLIKIVKENETIIFNEIDIKKIIKNNVDSYLGFLLVFVNKENQSKFETILENASFLNEEKIYKKKLIFNYFFINKNLETNDETFKLLFLIRNKKYKESIEFYKQSEIYKVDKNSFIIYDSFYNVNRIINEFGLFAFENKDYKFAFELLQRSYFNGFKDNENLLFILSIILENEIVDEKFYDVFYENLKCIDENPFLMESLSQKEEIFRAYFYLQNYDLNSCTRILNKILPNSDFNGILEEKTMKSFDIEINGN